MDRERSKRVEEIYRAALQQEPQHRDSFLVRVCGGDVDLHREVAALLEPSEATLTLGAPADWDTGAKQPEARNDLKTGERLGPYEVVGRLGAGGSNAKLEPSRRSIIHMCAHSTMSDRSLPAPPT